MKHTFAALCLLGFLGFAAPSQGYPVAVPCVGGPAAPAYAFGDWFSANRCADRIAAESQDCRRLVRTGRCVTQHYRVNRTPPDYCQCAPRSPSIGYWR